MIIEIRDIPEGPIAEINVNISFREDPQKPKIQTKVAKPSVKELMDGLDDFDEEFDEALEQTFGEKKSDIPQASDKMMEGIHKANEHFKSQNKSDNIPDEMKDNIRKTNEHFKREPKPIPDEMKDIEL